ncbi:MAG: MMPL family transporter [Acidimicrobiales bacterium]
MARALYHLGRAAVRRRRLVVLIWVGAAVVLGGVAQGSGGTFSDDFRVPGVESQEAIDILRERFPEQSGGRAQIVLHVDEGTLAEPARAEAIAASLRAVAQLDSVVEEPVAVPAGAVRPDSPVAERTALAEVRYSAEITDLGEAALADLDAAMAGARRAGVQVELGGDLAQYSAQPETKAAEALGVVAAVFILLFTFGSVIGMGLPIGIALFGLAVSTALMLVLASVVEVSTSAPILGTMIGIGVGIDYALFIVTRHRQHLVEGSTVEDAAGRANATAGQAVIFAGGTVVIAICGLALAGIPLVTTMGLAAAIVVAVMVVASITLLPALFGFAGTRLAVASLPWVRRREARQAARAERLVRLGGAAPLTRWERWGLHVSSHPWRYLGAGTAVLLLLSAPVLSMRLGQTDAGNSPPDSSIRRAYDLLAEGFGPGFNGPLLVVLEHPSDVGPAAEALTAALGDDPGVALVAPAQANAAGDTLVLPVIPASAPQAAETTELVHRLRRDHVPAVEEASGAAGYVSGLTAVFIDLSDKVASRLPVFIGAVVGLSFLLLMAVFRSVLVPLKAALMNLVSIGSAYGVVVAVFQWGWLKDVIGLEETVPIVSFVPMFMFAILFGLSMDYEVFLLSRVREEYLHCRDNTASVVRGIASTARVITSAALIMICVFLGFVLGDDPVIKMMGLGLATAVLVDATIVRLVLVPASMRLMGDANWWLPGWLDRLLPALDVEGGSGLPEPELRERDHPSADRPPVPMG